MYKDNQEDFFDRLVTQDEIWIYHHDLETKDQSKQWKHYDSPPLKRAHDQPITDKIMLTVLWD